MAVSARTHLLKMRFGKQEVRVPLRSQSKATDHKQQHFQKRLPCFIAFHCVESFFSQMTVGGQALGALLDNARLTLDTTCPEKPRLVSSAVVNVFFRNKLDNDVRTHKQPVSWIYPLGLIIHQ